MEEKGFCRFTRWLSWSACSEPAGTVRGGHRHSRPPSESAISSPRHPPATGSHLRSASGWIPPRRCIHLPLCMDRVFAADIRQVGIPLSTPGQAPPPDGVQSTIIFLRFDQNVREKTSCIQKELKNVRALDFKAFSYVLKRFVASVCRPFLKIIGKCCHFEARKSLSGDRIFRKPCRKTRNVCTLFSPHGHKTGATAAHA